MIIFRVITLVREKTASLGVFLSLNCDNFWIFEDTIKERGIQHAKYCLHLDHWAHVHFSR
jgi:hypothetical protein